MMHVPLILPHTLNPPPTHTGGVEGLLRVLRYGGARPEAQHAAARLLLDMASATHALSEELVSCGAVPALDSVLCDTSASGMWVGGVGGYVGGWMGGWARVCVCGWVSTMHSCTPQTLVTPLTCISCPYTPVHATQHPPTITHTPYTPFIHTLLHPQYNPPHTQLSFSSQQQQHSSICVMTPLLKSCFPKTLGTYRDSHACSRATMHINRCVSGYHVGKQCGCETVWLSLGVL